MIQRSSGCSENALATKRFLERMPFLVDEIRAHRRTDSPEFSTPHTKHKPVNLDAQIQDNLEALAHNIAELSRLIDQLRNGDN
jgi:hypothetical protein